MTNPPISLAEIAKVASVALADRHEALHAAALAYLAAEQPDLWPWERRRLETGDRRRIRRGDADRRQR